MAINTTMKVLGPAVAFAIAGQVWADGNRYDVDRYYQREISVSEAYLAMEHSKDFKNVPGQAKPVLIDVRRLEEYAAGHPEDAYNVPFPNLDRIGSPRQSATDFYWAVYDIVGGNLDAPIMLLCRTGSRSVNAGNILANPDGATSNDGKFIEDTQGKGLKPFTNVTNIWEGYVGQYRYAMDNSGAIVVPTVKLDLNNNADPTAIPPFDGIDKDYADVYTSEKDANPDKDGWRNFAGLPWTTQIQKPLAYQRDPGLYKKLGLVPVE